MRVIELTEADRRMLIAELRDADESGKGVRIAWDGGLKVKVGEGCWTPPLGYSPELEAATDEWNTGETGRAASEARAEDRRHEIESLEDARIDLRRQLEEMNTGRIAADAAVTAVNRSGSIWTAPGATHAPCRGCGHKGPLLPSATGAGRCGHCGRVQS